MRHLPDGETALEGSRRERSTHLLEVNLEDVFWEMRKVNRVDPGVVDEETEGFDHLEHVAESARLSFVHGNTEQCLEGRFGRTFGGALGSTLGVSVGALGSKSSKGLDGTNKLATFVETKFWR